MRGRLPFAVVGSNTIVTDDDGNMCRGREYPWGNVNIEDKVGSFNQKFSF
jgi:septin family protein